MPLDWLAMPMATLKLPVAEFEAPSAVAPRRWRGCLGRERCHCCRLPASPGRWRWRCRWRHSPSGRRLSTGCRSRCCPAPTAVEAAPWPSEPGRGGRACRVGLRVLSERGRVVAAGARRPGRRRSSESRAAVASMPTAVECNPSDFRAFADGGRLEAAGIEALAPHCSEERPLPVAQVWAKAGRLAPMSSSTVARMAIREARMGAAKWRRSLEHRSARADGQVGTRVQTPSWNAVYATGAQQGHRMATMSGRLIGKFSRNLPRHRWIAESVACG